MLLVLIGISADTAVVGTLLYRLVSFWLPIPVGASPGLAGTSVSHVTEPSDKPERNGGSAYGTAGVSAAANQPSRTLRRMAAALRDCTKTPPTAITPNRTYHHQSSLTRSMKEVSLELG